MTALILPANIINHLYLCDKLLTDSYTREDVCVLYLQWSDIYLV